MKWKIIIALLVAVLIVWLLFRFWVYFSNNSNLVSRRKPEQKCIYSNNLPKEFYLNQYKVKEGDTLLTIANTLLGDNSRIGEIVNFNKEKYPELSKDNSTIRTGWILWVPPKFFPTSSGYLRGSAGKIIAKTSSSFTITIDEANKVPVINYLVSGSKFSVPIDDEVGSCVYMVTDISGRIEAGIVAMTSQDHNYFKDPNGEFSYLAIAEPQNKCYQYGYLSNDYFTDRYTVQKSDSVISISQKMLADPSRALEIINLNKYLYPQLSIENPFIEVGWLLKLPSKNVPKSNGNLSLYAGEIVEVQKNPDYRNVFYIDIHTAVQGIGPHAAFFDNKTKFLGNPEPKAGDCVYSLEDDGMSIVITSQDKNYFN